MTNGIINIKVNGSEHVHEIEIDEGWQAYVMELMDTNTEVKYDNLDECYTMDADEYEWWVDFIAMVNRIADMERECKEREIDLPSTIGSFVPESYEYELKVALGRN